MDYVALILALLKTEAKSLGFNENELKSVAAICADNLGLSENPTDEEVNAAVDKAVKTVAIPILKTSQSASGRAIDAYKKAHPETDPSKEPPAGSAGSKTEEEKPQWAVEMQATLEALKQENASLRAERASTSRRERLNEVTKGTGKFGESLLKAFDRMSFKDDADFEEYFQSVETECKEYKQELANHGLESLSNPPAPSSTSEEKKELTDQQIEELAASYATTN